MNIKIGRSSISVRSIQGHGERHERSLSQVKVRYSENKGKEKVVAKRLELPPDVANGLVFTLMKDLKSSAPRTTVSMVATTPKPLLVKLAILPQGEEQFTIGSFRHKAMHYVVKVESEVSPGSWHV